MREVYFEPEPFVPNEDLKPIVIYDQSLKIYQIPGPGTLSLAELRFCSALISGSCDFNHRKASCRGWGGNNWDYDDDDDVGSEYASRPNSDNCYLDRSFWGENDDGSGSNTFVYKPYLSIAVLKVRRSDQFSWREHLQESGIGLDGCPEGRMTIDENVFRGFSTDFCLGKDQQDRIFSPAAKNITIPDFSPEDSSYVVLVANCDKRDGGGWGDSIEVIVSGRFVFDNSSSTMLSPALEEDGSPPQSNSFVTGNGLLAAASLVISFFIILHNIKRNRRSEYKRFVMKYNNDQEGMELM